MPAHASRAGHRFLLVRMGSPGDRVELAPAEAHHLSRVLRLGRGDRIAVFDGEGHEYLAEVYSADRSRAVVTLLEALVPASEPGVSITIAQAILKGPAMDAAVRDAVMIGASRIVPVLSAHVAVKRREAERSKTVERWRRIALASAKQCGRAVLARVEAPLALTDLLPRPGADVPLIFVEPRAYPAARAPRSLLEMAAPQSAVLLAGPEGGWRADEIDAAQGAGWIPLTLGRLTLRAETMPLCAGALVRFLWD